MNPLCLRNHINCIKHIFLNCAHYLHLLYLITSIRSICRSTPFKIFIECHPTSSLLTCIRVELEFGLSLYQLNWNPNRNLVMLGKSESR